MPSQYLLVPDILVQYYLMVNYGAGVETRTANWEMVVMVIFLWFPFKFLCRELQSMCRQDGNIHAPLYPMDRRFVGDPIRMVNLALAALVGGILHLSLF